MREALAEERVARRFRFHVRDALRVAPDLDGRGEAGDVGVHGRYYTAGRRRRTGELRWLRARKSRDAAAALDPRVLRSLDAIHLAAAQLFGDELTAVVTYDRRMAERRGW